MIHVAQIRQHLALVKQEATKFSSGNSLLALRYISLFAQIACHYNIQYADSDIESLLKKISQNVFGKISWQPCKGKIALFDSFAFDNRGLTQQYLRALLALGYEILYIAPERIGPQIQKEISSSTQITTIRLKQFDFVQHKRIAQSLVEFAPEKILLHLSPNDVSVVCLCNALVSAERFQINLTDHAFWLGTGCTDYSLEFRAYGAYLSQFHRKIPLEQQLLQPYYPLQDSKEFQGFPFPKPACLAFAGATLYKIADRNNTFLKLVHRILDENPQVVFALAGPGDPAAVNSYVQRHGLQNRFYWVGNRSDIYEVMKHIDIYINTYPMIGGLMSQYAAVLGKPLIGYTDPGLFGYNHTEDLLQTKETGFITHQDIDQFCMAFRQLVLDSSSREKNVANTAGCIQTPEQFSKRLQENLYQHLHQPQKSSLEQVRVNLDSVVNLYVEFENTYSRCHYALFYRALGLRSMRHFPGQVAIYIASKIREKLLKRFKK
jgi:hypothetical protein